MNPRVHVLGPSLASVLYAASWLGRLLGRRDIDALAFRRDIWRWSVSGRPVEPWVRRVIERELARRDRQLREVASQRQRELLVD